MHNRYFIINANDPHKDEILSFCVGEPSTQRYSLNGLQLVIKLCRGDHEQHEQLSQYPEYNHEQILTILNGPEWTGEPFLL